MGAMVTASLLTLPCLSHPTAQTQPVSNSNLTDSSLNTITNDPSLTDPPLRAYVDAHAWDPDPDKDAVSIGAWSAYVDRRIQEAASNVNDRGYNAAVEGGKLSEDFTPIRHGKMAFSITGVPGLTWGTVWDTWRDIMAQVDKFRVPGNPNHIWGLRFAVYLKGPPGPARKLALGELRVQESYTQGNQADMAASSVSSS